MRMYDIIHKKRDGKELTDEEIQFFIDGYTRGDIPDYQASALCMALFFRGMNERETASLTHSMAHSGDTVDLTMFGSLSVDKHSTGGVGDKTTLIVAPIVASLGGKVAKMSGRGLGHTGGTVDKLESIEGYRTSLPAADFLEQVEKVGVAVIGQTGNLAPADKKLYALRDVTATVESMPLIASSIMSKKIAAGSHSIVLDVKYGSGAFMKSPEDAEKLAREMVTIGTNCGRNMAALITDMDRPLGHAIGNSLEVKEAIEVLGGKGPDDLRGICVELASVMLSLCHGWDAEESRQNVVDALHSGKALAKCKEWIAEQGGNAAWIEDAALFPSAPYEIEVKAPQSGYITHMDTEVIGSVGVMLGAGRERKEDSIDFSAGIVLKRKTGDYVNAGDVIALLHTAKTDTASARERLLSAVEIGGSAPQEHPIVNKVIKAC